VSCLASCVSITGIKAPAKLIVAEDLIQIEQRYKALDSPIIHWNKLKEKVVLTCVGEGFNSAEKIDVSRRTCRDRRDGAICHEWQVRATYQCIS